MEELFPTAEIKQEYRITNPRSGRALWLDFYIPVFDLGIEVQGQQHCEFNPFFHRDASSFQIQKSNDEQKALWCEQNGVALIKVYYNEDISADLIWEKISAQV